MKEFKSMLLQHFPFFLLSELSWESESKQHAYDQLTSAHSYDCNLSRTLKNTNYTVCSCLPHFINFRDVFVHENETKPSFPAMAIKEYIYIHIDFAVCL